jgi:peptidyl-tRNA hydrolase, PTH1 family
VGFWFVDYLAHKLGLGDFFRESSCLVSEGEVLGKRLIVVKPVLYMNRCGRALSLLWRERPFKLENILVCYDDVALPAGKIRLRARGSAGGHKGMISVLEALGEDACARLRFGVAGEKIPEELSEYVLSPFEEAEETAVLDRFPDALEAVKLFMAEGIEPAMNRFNQ